MQGDGNLVLDRDTQPVWAQEWAGDFVKGLFGAAGSAAGKALVSLL